LSSKPTITNQPHLEKGGADWVYISMKNLIDLVFLLILRCFLYSTEHTSGNETEMVNNIKRIWEMEQ